MLQYGTISRIATYIGTELVKWEIAKRHDGDEIMLPISLLKFIKLRFIIVFNSKVAGKYEDLYEEYILLLQFRSYLLISFMQYFATFSNGLVFFHPYCEYWGVNLLSIYNRAPSCVRTLVTAHMPHSF